MDKIKNLMANMSGKVVFVALALFVLLYGALSTHIVRQLGDERFSHRENFAWAVFQVQRHYFELERELERELAPRPAPVGGEDSVRVASLDKVLLQYELFVSRVFLLRDGDGFEDLSAVPELVQVIDTIEAQIEKIDDVVEAGGDPVGQMTRIRGLLAPLDDDLQQAVVRTSNFVAVYNAGNIARVRSDIEMLSYFFFFGILVMLLLGYFIMRQRHKAFAADLEAQQARQEQAIIEEAADHAKMHALGTLAGGVAHEINTPAQYIQNNLEFLSDSFSEMVGAMERDTPDGVIRLRLEKDKTDFMIEEVPLAIDESIQGLQRIAEIVRGIRKFAHPATDVIEPLSIVEEIDTAVTLTRNQVKHVADLEVDLQADAIEVNGRRNHLSQALINLIVNAAQAIAETGQARGKIRLWTTSDAGNIYIHLRDSGGGVPEELRNRIFDYFFTTKERGVGTGQGLPICRKLVQDDFNGDLTLANTSDKGAEFVIRIPKPDTARARPDTAAGGGAGGLGGLGGLGALPR